MIGLKAVKKPSLEAESRGKRRVKPKSTGNYTYNDPGRAAHRRFRKTRTFLKFLAGVKKLAGTHLHETAMATTKPKRTTQTKNASWNAPKIITAGRAARVESTGTRPKFTPTSKHPRHERMRRRERVLVLELALVPLQFLF